MWADIVRETATFASGVLSGIDAQGFPCSLRCTPCPDEGAQVLRVVVGDELEMRPGPASLLCHYHNQQIWDLRSINVRGTLERDASGWYLRPSSFIPDEGDGGPLAMVKTIGRLRRTAASYLKQRQIATPQVPWKELNSVKKAAIQRAKGIAT